MLLLSAVITALATPYEDGVAALQEKRADAAISAFSECLAAEPNNADCHWEKGWAHWMKGDWERVVEHWNTVKGLDPERQGLQRYLSQAQDNLQLDALLAKARSKAAPSYKAQVPEGTTVRIRGVGDLMIGTDFPEGVLPPDDGKSAFDDVTDWLSDADITFGNLEGPLCDTGKTTKCRPDSPPGSCYAFRSPGRYKHVYQGAGFDVMSTANNHAGDFGEVCRLETERHLDDVGIAHTGRPGDIASLEANGLKIAFIGFHTSNATHSVNDIPRAIELVRAVDYDHDIVVVSFHGGAEGSKALHVPHGPETFYGENRGDLRKFTHAVVDAGADLVLGHGPHVLRAMEVYNGRLIAYSLGNFATYGRFNLSGKLGIGAVLDVTLDAEGTFVSGRILPTLQEGEGIAKKDPEGQALDLVRSLSEADFPATGVKVALDGTLAR